jgi:hypothetical protein
MRNAGADRTSELVISSAPWCTAGLLVLLVSAAGLPAQAPQPGVRDTSPFRHRARAVISRANQQEVKMNATRQLGID